MDCLAWSCGRDYLCGKCGDKLPDVLRVHLQPKKKRRMGDDDDDDDDEVVIQVRIQSDGPT